MVSNNNPEKITHSNDLFQYAMLHERQEKVPEKLLKEAHEIYHTLNSFLEKGNYVAGDRVTVADFSIITCITAFDLFVPIEKEKYPKLVAWVERMQGLPCYQVNDVGYNELKEIIRNVGKK